MEQSFACITQQKTKERLSKARCVSLQVKNTLSAKKQPYPAAGKRQAAGRRRSAVWSITPAVSEYARFQVQEAVAF